MFMGLQGAWSFSSYHEKWTLLVLSLLCFSALWWEAKSDTSSDDVNALRALLDSWGQKAVSTLQWTGNNPCGSRRWTGISCDDSSPQRVISLELPGLGLVGDLPSDISLLSELATLDLSYNNLTGSIPSQIGQLAHLSALYLQFNYFNGKIPPEIGQLKNLSTLSLNGNFLTGGIPNEIGLLENLYWLDLAQNQLSGPLPYSSDEKSDVNAGLDNLTKAGHFHLNNNGFSGAIPVSICHSGMSLVHLILDSNRLTGFIPGELGQCDNLLIMKLNHNQLQGAVPDEIGQLINITELQLNDNQLVGPLPNLSNLTNLGLLELSNNLIDEDFPPWMSSLESLTDLSMNSSSIKGQIPPSFFALPALSAVKLANNHINGTLDISRATHQLLLVSMEKNNIELVTAGTYSEVLRLQGNPVCDKENLLSEKVCSDDSSLSTPTSYGTNTCSNTCPSGYQVNPAQCTCAVPYQGILTYRAPTFLSLTNDSIVPVLAAALAERLSVEQKQVVIPSAAFNAQNQLLVVIAIFPSGTAIRWDRDDVLRMATILGKDGVSPPGFGPPMFQQYSADYTVQVSTEGSGLSTGAKIGIIAGSAALVLIVLTVICFACLQKRRADKAVELSKPFASWGAGGAESGSMPKLKGARFFPYAELKKATNNFSESNEIGSGGYGKVYRGILSSGEQVAIKRAQGNSMQGASEFKTEIELLSRVHHKNVVGLVGFCIEQGEQMLVYEYMAGGSLRDCLTGRSGVKLEWRRRLMIALGSARGITYLHELVTPPIIHRDIKSTNILLDEKKIAKVGDFGLSKIGPGEGSGKQHVSTQVKGTLGYLDPEYYISQQLTEKSDVYSYGVVLLELLTARAPIEHGKYVVKEVKTAIDRGGLSALRSMLDPRLRDEELLELNSFVRIALSCVEDAASSRPSMGEVVKQLEELVGHDYPESGSSNIDIPLSPTVQVTLPPLLGPDDFSRVFLGI
ncbi:hypothetical protein GOP47_0010237 [Adiantum capillus-veneris]|uniref:non-specific serine/threonine protein kinase n=1 Tax=Adiantum capillus-veneris TaxID=13818 RepID=A0A9D4ZIK4_ADICA|nr:hypothetical protein GOP47_0010237 [Adiantum capillus-veneris]